MILILTIPSVAVNLGRGGLRTLEENNPMQPPPSGSLQRRNMLVGVSQNSYNSGNSSPPHIHAPHPPLWVIKSTPRSPPASGFVSFRRGIATPGAITCNRSQPLPHSYAAA